MIILGLNFGHDAGISLVQDGVLRIHWEKERHSGFRHAIGLEQKDFDDALSYFGISLDAVDRVAVTTTQWVSLMLFDGVDIQFVDSDFFANGRDGYVDTRNSFFGYIQKEGNHFHYLARSFKSPPRRELTVREGRFRAMSGAGSPGPGPGGTIPIRDHGLGLVVNVGGRGIPGAFISHHLCHAYYAHGATPARNSLIISYDGGAGGNFLGGGVYFGDGEFVRPVAPHGFWFGRFYETVAELLGLGKTGAGKLMGLAAWGQPRYQEEALVGPLDRVPAQFHRQVPGRNMVVGITHGWLENACSDPDALAAKLRVAKTPPKLAADIAASAQTMFEANVLRVLEWATDLAGRRGFTYDEIILSGGCALNCPSNSAIWRRFGHRVFVPPAVNDEGISVGAAFCLASLMRIPIAEKASAPLDIAYKGRAYEIPPALVEAERALTLPDGTGAARFLAERIRDGAVVGVFEGRAEIGPRALGHRSIIASPLIGENWERLNHIKSRELWRPFAPMVLAEDFDTWFEDCPADSYYMLFNARVRGDKLPAITHRDGSARIQVVTPATGFVHDLLVAFRELTGVGVLVNTSFNGKNQPIVETPQDAVTTFHRCGMDYLYLQGEIIARAES